LLSTDETYIPKPDETAQSTVYHTNIDGNIRDYVMETAFAQSLNPVSPTRSLITTDASIINMMNLQRLKRMEKDNVPHHFWPYVSRFLPRGIPNDPNAALADTSETGDIYNIFRIIHSEYLKREAKEDTAKDSNKNKDSWGRRKRSAGSVLNNNSLNNDGTYIGNGPGNTVKDQRKIHLKLKESPNYETFSINWVALQVSDFVEVYGPVIVVIGCVLIIVTLPTIFFMVLRLYATDKFSQDQKYAHYGTTRLDHSMNYSNGIVGITDKLRHRISADKCAQEDQKTKILYVTGEVKEK